MLYEITNPIFIRMLQNLSLILDKAAAHATAKKFDTDLWFQFRLAPDQFPLSRQLQITCDTAKLCASRLTGKDAPVHSDNEKTFSEFKTRIDETIKYLNSLSKDDFKGASEKKISQPRWEGKWLTGEEFVLLHAIPNFYFHLTTSYAIFRHNGVDVGKKDYLGQLPFKS